MQLNVGHADGGHLARSVGQAPPGAVLVVVGGLAVDDSYKAGLGLLGADDTGVRQSGAQLFTVGGVQGQHGALTVRAGHREGELNGLGRVGSLSSGDGLLRNRLGYDLGGGGRGRGRAAARQQCGGQRQGQNQCRKLFHVEIPSLCSNKTTAQGKLRGSYYTGMER